MIALTERKTSQFSRTYTPEQRKHIIATQEALAASLRTFYRKLGVLLATRRTRSSIDATLQAIRARNAVSDMLVSAVTPLFVDGILDGRKQTKSRARRLAEAVAVDFPQLAPTDLQIRARKALETKSRQMLAHYYDELADDMLSTVGDIIENAIARGIDDGLDRRQITKLITTNTHSIAEYSARRIAQTEVIRVYAAGNLESYRENPLVESKEWIAAPDACPLCAKLDATKIAIDDKWDDEYDHPPRHPNCRCSVVGSVEEA